MAVLTRYGDHYGMHGEAIPDPDARVVYPDGSFGPMMFHYLSENCNPVLVAEANGFEMRLLAMHDVLPDDDPLVVAYMDGDGSVVRRWTPPGGTDGWALSGKCDHEDGPIAFYLRKPVTEKPKA